LKAPLAARLVAWFRLRRRLPRWQTVRHGPSQRAESVPQVPRGSPIGSRDLRDLRLLGTDDLPSLIPLFRRCLRPKRAPPAFNRPVAAKICASCNSYFPREARPEAGAVYAIPEALPTRQPSSSDSPAGGLSPSQYSRGARFVGYKWYTAQNPAAAGRVSAPYLPKVRLPAPPLRDLSGNIAALPQSAQDVLAFQPAESQYRLRAPQSRLVWKRRVAMLRSDTSARTTFLVQSRWRRDRMDGRESRGHSPAPDWAAVSSGSIPRRSSSYRTTANISGTSTTRRSGSHTSRVLKTRGAAGFSAPC